MPSPRQAALLGSGFSPYTLADNAAVYSLSGSASDATYLIDGSNRLYYVADRSGNSAVNVVCGIASGNYISTPDAAKYNPTTSLSIRVGLAADDWTPSGIKTLGAKFWAQFSWIFELTTTSTLRFRWSTAGGSFDKSATSSAAASFTDLQFGAVRADLALSTGNVTFYTSPDGVTWTQLGNVVTGAGATTVNDSTDPIEFLSDQKGGGATLAGKLYFGQVYVDGMIQGNCDPSIAAKLATSFVAPTTGETWTLTQSAIALPARIHGARDLYQGVQSSQPIFSVSGGYNIATFDGSTSYLKSAAYSLSQPESVYFVGSQVTWTNTDYIYDGTATNDAMVLYQTNAGGGGTPRISAYAGTLASLYTDTWTLGTRAVISTVFNGASSSNRKNRDAAVTASIGALTPNGVTLGAKQGGTLNSNITWSEMLVRSAADADALQLRIAAYEMRRWGVTP